MDSVKTNIASTLYVDDKGNKFQAWWVNGKLHRENGPAVEYYYGRKAYFLNGTEYSFEEWDRLRKMLWIL